MKSLFPHGDDLITHRNMMRVLGGVVVACVLFALGIYLSGLLDKHTLSLMNDLRGRIKQRYGVSTSIGHVETGFGSLRLGEVNVGEPTWMTVDRVDISVSLNPLSGFLRPKAMTIGRAVVKVPWNKERWPQEVRLLYEAIKRRGQTSDGSATGSVPSAFHSFVPQKLNVNAARVESADGDQTKFLGEDLNVALNLADRKMTFGARRVQILEWVDESFVGGDFDFKKEEVVSASFFSRLAPGEPLTWSFACEGKRDASLVSCQIDASHLPRSLLSPVTRWFGKGFSPSYRGAIIVDRSSPGVGDAPIKITLDGQLGDVFVEHSSIAIGVVGPGFLGLKLQGEIDLQRKIVRFSPSSFALSSADQQRGPATHQIIPVNFDGELSLQKNASSDSLRPTGFINADMPATECQSILKAIPQSFLPDVAAFRLGGAVQFQAAATLVDGIPEIKIEKGSVLGCEVLGVPEIYSSAYLSGPFNIERNLPDGKIYIPVDPARPYFAAYHDVPPLVRAAFVSSEDAGFFQHKGVELSAIIGALERNTEEGRAAVGGSTITMQTVKNLFLARDKTISRKVQEIFLAWHLDRTISKERILEIYLNMVEFGPGLYGIGLASQRFFGISHKDLSLKQAIYLASLLPAPVPRYRYFCKGETTPNYERLLRQLLDRMLGLGRITPAQHAMAVSEKIQFSDLERESACGSKSYAGSEGEVDVEIGQQQR